ncbi:MAG: hypothetical protein ACXVC6_15020 [Bacteroidia bacterium]
MENKKNKSIVAGSMLAGALLSLSVSANANSLFNYNALGSGSEVRNAIELSCGEKKADDKKAAPAKDAKGDKKAKDAKCGEKKAKDGKCGEGKCGEKKNPK